MSWSGAWPTVQMQASRRRLEELRTNLQDFSGESPEIGAHLSRLLVIRSTGFVEHTFETCIQHFAEAHSHPSVAHHVASGLFRGRNPWPNVLLERTKSLSADWEDELREFFDDDDARIRRELEFMVDRRNRIAHGQSESVNRRKALDLATVSLDVGDWLTVLIDPR